ncbi:hypothetical protein CAPGI0001_1973 [Capnocytophaga gingivalis ATCC 33624]|uniref:Uncharacterized protein n=1 Tax=Capnocytophaga gingivalis TaxID=1017 RepID=A0A250FN77_9FLAO|nr:hypothetical protein [Capnocytophaga gingivalis]ATA85835.1 hypothetical protein CGC50_00895 [Capnocytophaga gingivalis]EEK13500.1 hypothetical protein CAPGI0001_1973 [Capnocytophaga gingivalis ATCC 33624]
MSSISLLLCRALMIEFVVILLSLLGVGSLFFGIEALGIIINFFIFILVGAICCIPIAIGIGEYLSRSNKFLIKKLPLGILLMLFFYSFGVFSSITIISIGQGKGFVSMEELLEVIAFSLLLGAFPSFGVGIWLDGKLLAMIKPPEE